MIDTLSLTDFSKILNLEEKNLIPGFLMYNYEHTSHEGYSRLSLFRQDYYEVSMDLTSGCTMQVDVFSLPSIENRLTIIAPHRLQKIIQSEKTSEEKKNYKGFSIFFKEDFLHTGLYNVNLLADFPFLSHLHSPTILLKQNSASFFIDLVEKIYYEYINFGVQSTEVIKNYLNILLLKAKQYYQVVDEFSKTPRENGIYDTFVKLVQQHSLTITSVNVYAEMMNVSAKHLSETVKKISGSSALHIIHEMRLNHAKALLVQTKKTASEIAYILGFENPHHFSSFFKRLTGVSPLQFRIS
jgi:AraC family transcriptional regulator, transcriptional activator of pobA